MMRWLLCLSAVALFVVGVPAQAGEITGQYVEARTTEVFAGPCFANADTSLTGKNAVMAWKVDKGSLNGVTLDGLGIAAVVAASDTLGLPQSGASRALLIVDTRASAQQREALIQLAKKQAGKLLDNVIAVQIAPVEFTICPCKEGGCAVLTAGSAKIETRCINAIHDKTCGNEYPMYPPLASNVKARVAFTVEHSFQGKGMNETWRDSERRGAYLGTFEMR
jgi:hypothetical protein